MRKFVGFSVVLALLIVGFGFYASNSSPLDDDEQATDSAALTAEATTHVPTARVQDDPDEDNRAASQQLDPERCFPGAADANTPVQGKTVVIDPGHGGEDLGTVNRDFGLNESDLVLNISHLLRNMLNESGAIVCMTRVEDVYVGLAQRAYFANDNGGDAFVSMHLNSLPDPGENYTMTIWGNEAKDRFLSEKILEVLRYEMAIPQDHNGLANPMSPAVYTLDSLDSYMLKSAEMPATLVEASFLSSTWEAQVFMDGIEDGTRWREYQIAEAVYVGIMQYFEAFE